MASETSQTLDRGLRVLEVLADAPDGLSVTELAARLGTSRTVVYRLVVTLEQHSLLRRGLDGRARLGMGVIALARQIQPILREVSAPILRRLAQSTNSTAHVSVLEADSALTVAVVEPLSSDIHVAHRIGSRTSLDKGAAGRAIIASRTGRGLEQSWVTSAADSGAVGVAAPILGIGLEASVGVFLLSDDHVAEVGPQVVRAAAEIARVL